MIKKWPESVDNDGAFGAFMTDLTKAFECSHQGLFIANPDAH